MAGSILLVSDIHADAGALAQILDLAFSEDFSRRYGPVEKVLNLGDLMERGYYPQETVDRLKNVKGQVSILGNHDEAFLQDKPLSGSDMASVVAHEQYRATRKYEDFFEGMGVGHVDRAARLYAVHGGPIDPASIVPEDLPEPDAWLFSQTWQRISDTGYRYLDASGYHYLVEDAFDAMKTIFEGPGYVMVCGHEHAEAAFVKKGRRIEDMLERLEKCTVRLGTKDVEEKTLPLREDACHLVRVGLAGPEGYARMFGLGYCNIGVLAADPRRICLLRFRRDMQDAR